MDSALTPAPSRPVTERTGVEGRRLRPGRPLLAGSARRRAGVVLACCAAIVALLGVLFSRQTDGGLVRSRGRRSGPEVVRRPSRSRAMAGLARQADSGGHPERGCRHHVPAHRPPEWRGAGRGDYPRRRRARRTPAQAAGPPHLSRQPRLSQRAYHGRGRIRGDGCGAASHPAAPGQVRGAAHRSSRRQLACSVVVVAIAVIGLGWHYFTDTVAGAAVGIGTVCALALILDLPVARRVLAWVTRERATAGESD